MQDIETERLLLHVNSLEEMDMAIAKMKAAFQSEIKDVWNVVTSLDNTEWRSDISKIEVISDKQFIEYTKDGYATIFTITVTKPFERWEFDMENSNMRGHWTGIFSIQNGQTEIEFTEDVTAKKLIMKPFVKAYLKRQQKRYVLDLRKVLL